MGGALQEMISSADVFKLEFTDETLTPEQKATFLSTLLLTDYTYFESNNDKCGTDEEGRFFVNLCNCYCMGCVLPCKLTAPKQ
jgi:hypothetical protein